MSKARAQAPQDDLTAAVASPERLALEQLRGQFDDMTGTCADCNHPADLHADTAEGDNTGACSASGCDCGGMKAEAAADVEELVDVEALVKEVAEILSSLPNASLVTSARLTDFVFAVGDPVLLDEHQPDATTVPSLAPTPKNPVQEQPTRATNAEVQWTATFAPEGKLTDDGRAFAPGSISWRELPLTLMGLVETGDGGHQGALVSGRIDQIWRDEAAGLIKAAGIFDNGEFGQEVSRLVEDRTITGVSVDLAIHEYEVGPQSDWFDEEGNWAPKAAAEQEEGEEPSLIDLLFGEEEDTIFVVTDAVIGMCTVCPFPAFAEATIEIAASIVSSSMRPGVWTVTQQGGFTLTEHPLPMVEIEGDLVSGDGSGEALPPVELTASAAGFAPVVPPVEWFSDPEFEALTPLTVTEEGRVYGHAWEWDTCHIGIPGVCTTAPRSAHDYAYFHLGELECEGGERVSVGKITLDTGHGDRHLSRVDAVAHYDDTGTVVADVVCGEDAFGGWFSGAIRPEVSAEKVRVLRAAVLSGDWRNVNGGLELVALLAVNIPGFPVPRPRALVASSDDGSHVLTLLAAGLVVTGDEAEAAKKRFAEKFQALSAKASGSFDELAARAKGE